MKKVKSWVCLILTAAMLLVLPACGGNGETADSDSANSASGETYTWRIAHNNAEDSQWQLNLLELSDLVKEASGGQLVIELYPNSQLGEDTARCEMIRNRRRSPWEMVFPRKPDGDAVPLQGPGPLGAVYLRRAW